jgi:hypothetical protein
VLHPQTADRPLTQKLVMLWLLCSRSFGPLGHRAHEVGNGASRFALQATSDAPTAMSL